ncbi:RICIN domain-containing protein [Nonomuraea lactucae]|uniref:RICIN domain-containing protein n=1 Tax=Nonomuraea lactucae TaxID=2249762 RepID=UPI0013B3746A|nr:RICIN domain-containing protein [Nonomuraea lactucae]
MNKSSTGLWVRAGRLGAGTLIALVALTLLSTHAAHADGRVLWQNQANNNYLEIWLSSTSVGGEVIVWPENPTSMNQRWWEYAASNGYLRYANANSGLSMYSQSGCFWGIIQNNWGGGSRGSGAPPISSNGGS